MASQLDFLIQGYFVCSGDQQAPAQTEWKDRRHQRRPGEKYKKRGISKIRERRGKKQIV